MTRPTLRVVSKQRTKPSLAQQALGQLSPLELSGQSVDMHHKFDIASPPQLRRPLRFMPLSPSMGMGLVINTVTREPVVHLDYDFLDMVLEGQKKSWRKLTTAYFVLAAAAHSITRDTPEIALLARQDPQYARTKSWMWAGSLAMAELNPAEATRKVILSPIKEAAIELDTIHQNEMMFFVHQSEILGVEPPKIRPVVPWIGIAFPNDVPLIPQAYPYTVK